MRLTARSARLAALVCCALILLPACGTSRRAQLHRVAKDWCETIRASQVIAVYPLTEDIQPGDVFLVQVPIDRQQEIYKKNGFLPLDNRINRLNPSGYKAFYRNSFLSDPADQKAVLPSDWLKNKWVNAPSASFPNYSFSVNSSQGIGLAIPVSGVPVGMSLMGTQTANGTVSLKDARTIGVDTLSLYKDLKKKIDSDPDLRAMIANYGVYPGQRPRNYLRIVTRVYLLGAIDVQINDARAVSAGLDVGVPRPVNLFIADPPTGVGDVKRSARENYLQGINRMGSLTSGGQNLGTPDGAGLTAEQFEAREKIRKEEQQKAIDAAKEKLAEAEKKLAEANKAAEPQKTEIANLRAELLKQLKEQAALKAALKEAREGADADKIKAAEAELKAKQGVVAAANQTLSGKQDVFDKGLGKKAQEAAALVNFQKDAASLLKDFAPGGSVRFNSASSRSVSLTETFKRPQVVGYLGFDVPIGVLGELGPPIPTHALLDNKLEPKSSRRTGIDKIYKVAAMQDLYPILEADAAANKRLAMETKKYIDKMTRFIPTQYGKIKSDPKTKTMTIHFYPAGNADFKDYLLFVANNDRLINRLRAAESDSWRVVYASDTKKAIDPSKLAERLELSNNIQLQYNRACQHLIHAVMNGK